MKQEKQKPSEEIRIGRIKAAIWTNKSDAGIRRNVTFSRLYKDAKDQWKSSDSFSRDDLPLLVKLADQVHSRLYERADESDQ